MRHFFVINFFLLLFSCGQENNPTPESVPQNTPTTLEAPSPLPLLEPFIPLKVNFESIESLDINFSKIAESSSDQHKISLPKPTLSSVHDMRWSDIELSRVALKIHQEQIQTQSSSFAHPLDLQGMRINENLWIRKEFTKIHMSEQERVPLNSLNVEFFVSPISSHSNSIRSIKFQVFQDSKKANLESPKLRISPIRGSFTEVKKISLKDDLLSSEEIWEGIENNSPFGVRVHDVILENERGTYSLRHQIDQIQEHMARVIIWDRKNHVYQDFFLPEKYNLDEVLKQYKIAKIDETFFTGEISNSTVQTDHSKWIHVQNFQQDPRDIKLQRNNTYFWGVFSVGEIIENSLKITKTHSIDDDNLIEFDELLPSQKVILDGHLFYENLRKEYREQVIPCKSGHEFLDNSWGHQETRVFAPFQNPTCKQKIPLLVKAFHRHYFYDNNIKNIFSSETLGKVKIHNMQGEEDNILLTLGSKEEQGSIKQLNLVHLQKDIEEEGLAVAGEEENFYWIKPEPSKKWCFFDPHRTGFQPRHPELSTNLDHCHKVKFKRTYKMPISFSGTLQLLSIP